MIQRKGFSWFTPKFCVRNSLLTTILPAKRFGTQALLTKRLGNQVLVTSYNTVSNQFLLTKRSGNQALLTKRWRAKHPGFLLQNAAQSPTVSTTWVRGK